MASENVVPKLAKDDLFDRWLHFTDDELEKEFRVFSVEDCKQTMLVILSWSNAIYACFVLYSLATFLAGSSLAWDLELRLIFLGVTLLAWFYCQFFSFWRPWYVKRSKMFIQIVYMLDICRTCSLHQLIIPRQTILPDF